ncbi:MAG: Cna B-type domain-containing protein [Eubacterium pyruvativorans]|uniref:Cna B-type domain-containing protein n=2 Tax=Eubacterium pyruvativorans TaxID=155865 RepID=UPI002A7EE20E|nr:Cna B-type domain-containing protein [Eubacterium pyruvativorans]MDY4049184.1 Cna B-type domain-containing protein [Eubacterium pyruvativorans]
MKGKDERRFGWRKLLVISLSVMMAVMFMPASALAGSETAYEEQLQRQLESEKNVAFDSENEASIDGKEYATIGEALDAAKAGDTVTLLRDVNRDFEIAAFSETDTTKVVRDIGRGGIEIPSGKDITLNLNAHQVMKSSGEEYAYSIKVDSGSTVRIVNQPTEERRKKLDSIGGSDIQLTQREQNGRAVLTSGIVNNGSVALDQSSGEIKVNNSGVFYNSGSLHFQGDFCSGNPYNKFTLKIVEQTKDAEVSFGDGFNADGLEFQLPKEVLNQLNAGTREDDYLLARGGDAAFKLLENDKYYPVQGLDNSKVSLEKKDGDRIMLCCQKAIFYLDPKNGKDENDGTSADNAVQTLDKALELYNQTDGLAEIHVLNTVSLTSDLSPSVKKTDSDDEGSNQESRPIRFARDTSFRGALFDISGEKANVKLSNVTIDGKNLSAEAPLIRVSDGGSLTLEEGAVLKNNANCANGIARGGAIYAEGPETTVHMNGGKIESCSAVWGGGIFLRDASFIMDEGVISGNTTSDVQDQRGTGGGVCVAYNGTMKMTGGTISGNTARNGGGVSAGVDQTAVLKDTEEKHLAFTMTGGTISGNKATKEGNTAQDVNGGGLYVACRNVAELEAGSISDNRVNNSMGFAGGGIYVNGGNAAEKDDKGIPYSNGKLIAKNVYFSGNRDGGDGAALALCPTSHLQLHYDGNVVIDPAGGDTPDLFIQFTEIGPHVPAVGENGDRYVSYFLSSVMQDGSSYGWTERDGRTFETDADAKLKKDELHLIAHPAAGDVSRNKPSCKVWITGNSTGQKGGGIASNGDLSFGSKPTPPAPTPAASYRQVTVQKDWTLDDGKMRPDSVQVQLMRNGVAYGSPVTLNDGNNWTFTWSTLEKDESQWTVSEVLVPEGFMASQQATEEGDSLRVVITNDDQPEKPDQPTNPDKPDKPSKPTRPSKPAKPTKPSKPARPAGPNSPGKMNSAGTPRTGDEARVGMWLILFGGAAALLAVAAMLKRKVDK